MKVPNRIYLANFEENPSELDRTWYYAKQVDCHNAEYIQTDAFIDKACEGIKHLLSGYIIRNFHFGDSYEMDTLIEDFRKAMKGE